jgi:aldose sugar dehydrogenase
MNMINKKHPALIMTIFCLLLSITIYPQDTISGPPMTVKTKSEWLKIEKLASLNEPWGMAWLPDGRLLITEKPGRLRIYANGKLSEPIAGLPPIDYHKQGGLLDVEVDPQFSQNKWVYLYFVERTEPQPLPKPARDPGDPRLGEYQDYEDVTLKGGAVAQGRLEGNQLKDVKIIWRQVPKTIGRGHFGGRIVFSPDGTLFITSGDRQRFDPAQDLSSNVGKIIRINKDGSSPGNNPYVNTAGARSDIWSLGHRNPLGATIHPTTKQLWIHEMGPMHGDEINIPEAGKNYGWPEVSNGDNYNFTRIPDHETKTNFSKPIYFWHPAVSPSGMIFYTGNLFKDWNGGLLLGSFNLEGLIKITFDSTDATKIKSEERIGLQRRIRDVIQDSDGSLLLITDYPEGELIRLSAYKR